MKYHKPSSYLLALGDHLRWSFTCSPDTEAWLAWMARILGLRHGEDDGSIHVHFIRRPSSSRLPGSWLFRLNRFPSEQLSAKLNVPTDGWTMRNFGSIRIWSHLAVSNIICELSPKKNKGRELVMMWYALHIIYSGLARSGGLPLHAALVSIGGMGSLIAGGDGAGKSTCCRRIMDTWNVLADDGVLIVPRNGASCVAHPLPTWSDLIMDRNQRTCLIEQGVPLSAVFFLEKDSEDRAIPLGQGHASLMINASASTVVRQGWKKPDPIQDRNLRNLIFDNSCRMSKTVPAFLLMVSPSGEFWKRMEGTLPLSRNSLGNSSAQHRH